MDCEQARQLFDAYLNGELSPRLATELGAHRVRCTECRRALALLEVTGHIIASDDEPVSLQGAFADRLLACVESPKKRWTRRLRRGLYIAGSLAAAAVFALAFIGIFDSDPGRVAGEKVESEGLIFDDPSLTADLLPEEAGAHAQDGTQLPLERSVEQTRENLIEKLQSVEQSVESLQHLGELTIAQLLDMLNEAKEKSLGADHFPGADATEPMSSGPQPADVEGVERP